MSDDSEKKKRDVLPRDPRRDETLADIGLPNISMYRRDDLMLVRQMVRQGTMPATTMARLIDTIALLVDDPDTKERTKVTAFKAVSSVWLKLLSEMRALHADEVKAESEAAPAVTNQQINIYLPDNGRVPTSES